MPNPAPIFTMFVFALAGFCLFMALLNRVLILIPDGPRKNPIILSVFAALCGGGLPAGYFTHNTWWIVLPTAVLLITAIMETHRLILRSVSAGSKPVEVNGSAFNLRKPITTTDLNLVRYEVPHPKWQGKPLRIVHLTNMHVTHHLPLEYYTQAIARIESLEPDLLLFTGDYITKRETLHLEPIRK